MIVSHRFTIPVTYYRMEPTEDGRGMHSVVDRTVRETVEVSVDFSALAETLGVRACKSKGGKAREVHGLVIVRHLRQKGGSP